MGRLNNHEVDNGYVEVYPSDNPLEYSSESITHPDTNLIKSIDDDEMEQLLNFFHSENENYILNVDLQTLQA